MKKNNEKELEKLKENLKDPIYMNYNLLVKLDEIKNILLAIFQVNKETFELLNKTELNPEEEKREGVFNDKK